MVPDSMVPYVGAGPYAQKINAEQLRADLVPWAARRQQDGDFKSACVARLAIALEFLRSRQEKEPLTDDMASAFWRLVREESVRVLCYARDLVADLFDEQDEAVKTLMGMAIKAAKAKGKYVGICGQGPSDHPALAQWLMEQGIDSVSLNPDSVLSTWLHLAGEKA